MAELNFGLLTPPGSQPIGNAFVSGMDQAAVARAQENQNALAQYTLGKAKREDELTNRMLTGLQGADTIEQQAAVLRSVGRVKEANDLLASGLERRYKLGQIEAQTPALQLTNSNLLDKALDRYKSEVPKIQTPDAVASYVQQTYADSILGPYAAKLKPLDQAIEENVAQFTANPDKWRAMHTNISGLQILQATMPKPQVVGGNLVNTNAAFGQIGAPIAGAPTIPQSPVAKLQADIEAAKARNAPPAEIAALEQEAGRLSRLADIAGGQLQVSRGNLAVNEARLKLAQDAPKLGLTDPADIERIAVAVADGRIPVDRLNSATARIYAGILKVDPDINLTNTSIEQAGARAQYIQNGRIAVRQTLTAVDADRAENIANGNLPPATGINADKIMNAVIKLNPEYNARDYGLQTTAEKSFNTGKQGDKTRSLNVAVSHLGTLDTAAAALHSDNIRVFNQFKQAWQRETGKTAPTDFNAVRELVADEIVAAVVPGVGALADRKALKDTIMAKSSPAQLQGVIKQYKELLGGQLGGLEQQYNAATGKTNFKQRYLTPEARAALVPGQTAPPAGATSTATNTNPYAAKTDAEILRALEGK
jgi:hypothetical protein